MSAAASYLSVEEAQSIVLAQARPGGRVTLPLIEALGLTLAEAVRTDVDYPPFDRAMMDGFAVRAADVQTVPAVRKLIGEIAAGALAERALGAGEALQINTGAVMPAGADAVVRLEDAHVGPDRATVRIDAAAAVRQHVALRGEYVRAGEVVLEAGRRLGPAQIGVAGSAGADRVTVYAPPRVAVLSTGDELVDIDQVPTGAQIRNSNSYALMALAEQAGGRALNLGNVPDNKAAIAERVCEGLACDVLCITGGVSVGQFDLVPAVLAECGVRVLFHKMKTKPGKPTLFGVADDAKLVFALPGNPISAFVGFWLLARPALAAVQGRPNEIPRAWPARLRGRLKAAGDRQSYHPARMSVRQDELAAEVLKWGGSGDPFGMGGADAMIVRPISAPAASDGDRVDVLLLDNVW